ncbi:hypothetical protein [Microcoleus sp. herbarium12]|uniref:hypothetical protein n=1 Tax=Microcoleus sp. herbarium12 TaxID=3055437 RepID=UPI002FD4CB8B
MLVILFLSGNNFRKTWEILSKTQPKFGVNLLVRTPAEIEQRLAWNDLFVREIIEKGKVIYESADSLIYRKACEQIGLSFGLTR